MKIEIVVSTVDDSEMSAEQRTCAEWLSGWVADLASQETKREVENKL